MKHTLYRLFQLGLFAVTVSQGLPVYSASKAIEDYLGFCKKHAQGLGSHGDHHQGEIEIIFEPKEIERIQHLQHDKLIKLGMSEKAAYAGSRVGIISCDHYWVCLRDAVIFPNGAKGVANRVIYQAALTGPAGVIIAPLLPDGRIALILNFRHATRSWELELPRGGRLEHETIEQAATRECLEETGYRLQNQVTLGLVNLDSGMTSTEVPLILGHVSDKRSIQADEFEAIEGVLAFTKIQLKEALKKGFIEIPFKGQLKKMNLKDPCIAYVILAAEEKGLW